MKHEGEQAGGGSQSAMESWVQGEVTGCSFNDRCLDQRFAALLQQSTDGVGQSIPFACQDWTNTKAAYRFFSNPKVNEEDILSDHLDCNRERVKRTDGLVLVLHDTTEFSHRRDDVEAIGITHDQQRLSSTLRPSGSDHRQASGQLRVTQRHGDQHHLLVQGEMPGRVSPGRPACRSPCTPFA